jgi:hypothetical protein
MSLFLGITLLVFCIGCSSGSRIQGKVTDKMTGGPVSNVSVIAATRTNIVEDKKFEEIVGVTGEDGQFLLKGLSPKYNYRVTVYKQGYSKGSFDVMPPEIGQTKEIGTFRIFVLAPSAGIFGKTNAGYLRLPEVPVESAPVTSTSAVQFQSPASITSVMYFYYVAKKVIADANPVELHKGDHIMLNLPTHSNQESWGVAPSWNVAPVRELSIDHDVTRYLSGDGRFPEGLYCGLSRVYYEHPKRSYDPGYLMIENSNVDTESTEFWRVDLTPGTYIITRTKFWHGAQYNPSSGWVFSVK